MSRIRLGVVGIGGMGTFHANYILKGEVPDAELIAVCDTDPARLQHARENFGENIQCFDNADALCAANIVDAVLIATPHYDHPTVAIKAFEAGLHVLSEKPAGVYTRQVRQMNEAAAKSGKIFGMMFNLRTIPIYRKLKDMIDSGELGEIQRTNWIATSWYRPQSYYDSGGWRATWAGEGGGVLLNQCPHNLDMWQWACGMPKRVRAYCSFGKYHEIEVEDDVTAYVEYENGATGVFVATTADCPGTNRLEVTGDRGKVVVELVRDVGYRMEFWRTRVPISQFNREWKNGFGEPECWKCEVPTAAEDPEHHQVITRAFVKAVREGGEPLAHGAEGINSLELSNAMLLSSWTDSTVELPVNEDLFYEKMQERIEASTYQKKTLAKTLDVKGTF